MESNLAASRIELEAKLIEVHFDSTPFEPAHLTTAARNLEAQGVIKHEARETRGGRPIPLYVVADLTRRRRRVEDAAGRKRLLMARYYSYVQGSDSGSSLAGPAGELAFDAALTRANPGARVSVYNRGLPSVPQINGTAVPMGPLDNAFVVQRLDKATRAPIPPWGVTALVEVKNVRDWIYPSSPELFQLLHKAAVIQNRHPDQSFLPVLVCRRAHTTTAFMAKDLGFFVIDARRQYLAASSIIEPDHFQEMTDELGLVDMVIGHDSTARIENRLVTLQQYFDLDSATATWKAISARTELHDLFRSLNKEQMSPRERTMTLDVIRRVAKEEGASRGW
jgi:hypothetical protein